VPGRNFLLVEPDPPVAAFARRVLRFRGAHVAVMSDPVRAMEELRAGRPYDGVVLAADDACRRMREEGIWITALLLIEPGGAIERARASGADGYLRKPFSGAQLISALLDLDGDTGDVSAAGLELHPGRRTVTKAGTDVHLSPIEFALLELLARHAGDVVDRARLVEHGWTYDYANGSNVVEVYLGRLRGKIDRPFGTRTIDTVRGKGYRLAP
jgi:two-component system OmpR family response regulator